MANPPPPASLLGLPREIRDSIYEYCSPPQTASEVQNLWWGSKVKLGATGLLRVCTQIHDEAAPIFYGNKIHVFCLGSRNHDPWSLRELDCDNKAMRMAPTSLARIKYLILFVDPAFDGETNRRIFLKYKAKLHSLATNLAGNHSLRELRIVFNRYDDISQYNWGLTNLPLLPSSSHSSSLSPPPPLPLIPLYSRQSRWHHILEPLAEIYGVPRVRVGDVTPEFAYMLERAMECHKKAVSPRDEPYRITKVKRRGRVFPRRIFKLKFHESKLVWNNELLGPMPPVKDDVVKET